MFRWGKMTEENSIPLVTSRASSFMAGFAYSALKYRNFKAQGVQAYNLFNNKANYTVPKIGKR
jgi:hypothetical protein